MKNNLIKILCFAFVMLITAKIQAQYSTVDSLNTTYLNWYNLDSKIDKIQGASVDRAYNELLKNKTPKKKIIVAVIDGGVDTAHADLKGKIWLNKDEIPNNGIDDDNNGYIDDMHGWNFIGNTNGKNILNDNYEYIRILKKGNELYKNVKSINDVPALQQNDYKTYLLCKAKYDKEIIKMQDEEKFLTKLVDKKKVAENKIKTFLNTSTLNQTDVFKINSKDHEINQAKELLLSLYSSGVNNEYLKKIRKSDSNKIVKNLNMEVDFREIIGDNPDDINDNKYGNNNVKGPDAGHGTLVAGVIAANRNNKIGINGVAEGVEIMAMRVVPDGDEYDKDVALAIKYAVDNGANVINMSFGKAYSPQKKFVEEAIKYAEKHNVLLVHAAGNDGVNNDSIEHYPTAKFDDGTISNNVLTIGASTFKADKNFAGFFSNYGQSVDIFAPGVNIISLLPENKYTMANGTSFSCPLVTGVAALVWSFYPELTALQLAEIIKKSGTRHSRLKVYCPEKQTPKQVKIKFAKLCNTGASVNAYKALIMAEKFTGSISK